MQSSGRPRVFLSYAREDIDVARALRKDLEALSIDVWFDETSLLPGQKWRREISRAIRESEFFAVLLSRSSLTKRGVIQREIREAIEVAKELPEDAIFVIPVRLEDVRPTDGVLNDIQWVDLFPHWAEGIRRMSLTVYSRSSSTLEATRLIGAATILEMIARAAANLDADISYRLPPRFDRTAIIASEMALFTALTELVANTVAHGERNVVGGVRVEVTLHVFSDHLKIEIINIATDASQRPQLSTIFQRFGRGIELTYAAIAQIGGILEVRYLKEVEMPQFAATVTLPRADNGPR